MDLSVALKECDWQAYMTVLLRSYEELSQGELVRAAEVAFVAAVVDVREDSRHHSCYAFQQKQDKE